MMSAVCFVGSRRRSALVGAASVLLGASVACADPLTPDLFNWQGPCFNCYNYAANTRGNNLQAYFAQPGDASGGRYGAPIQCNTVGVPGGVGFIRGVKDAAIADGLMFLGNPAPGQPLPNAMGKCVVALAVRPGRDFHWYRLNGDGTWSDKPGQTKAQNFGNVAPHTNVAGRGLYTQFCGYFGVDTATPPPLVSSGDNWLNRPLDDNGGYRKWALSFSGFADAPFVSSALDLLDLLTHTPTGAPLAFVPTQPNLILTGDAGCSALLDNGTLIFPGLSQPVRYLQTYISPDDGQKYIAAYTQLEPQSSGDIVYYRDNMGMYDYLCPIPAPGVGALLAMAGVVCMARRRRS